MEVFYLIKSVLMLLVACVPLGLLVFEWLMQSRRGAFAGTANATSGLNALTRVAVLWCLVLTLLFTYICIRDFWTLADGTLPSAYLAQGAYTLLPVAGMGWLTWSIWDARPKDAETSAPIEAQHALLGLRILLAAIFCLLLGTRVAETLAYLLKLPELPPIGGAVREYFEILPSLQAGGNTKSFGQFQWLGGIISAIFGWAILRSIFIYDPKARHYRLIQFKHAQVWRPVGIWFLAHMALPGLAFLMLELPQTSDLRVAMYPTLCVVGIAFYLAVYLVLAAESVAIVRARRMASFKKDDGSAVCPIVYEHSLPESTGHR